MEKQTLKSIGAIAAGFFLTLILTIGLDILLESTGIFTSTKEQQIQGLNTPWFYIIAISYRVIFTIIGGYITAKLAPTKPMKHVLILGIIGTVLALIGNIVGQYIPQTKNALPLWFAIALVVTALPSVWIGGRLATKNIISSSTIL
ncbi:MAG: hypothetical protein ABIQ27_10345 [Flavobacterium sp.]|uniref:hypothetical protein n=1 Tax=Flavobacterium sp. TaxID=239 RepID=UPI003262EE31